MPVDRASHISQHVDFSSGVI